MGIWQKVKLASELIHLQQIANMVAALDCTYYNGNLVQVCVYCPGHFIVREGKFVHTEHCPKSLAEDWRKVWPQKRT